MTTNLREAIGRNEYFSQVLVRRIRVACGQWPVASKEVGSGSGMPLVRLEDSAHPTVSAKLWVVGLGPGNPELLTRRALEVLQQAEVIVGYEGYLNLLGPLNLPAELRGSPIGKERERALEALELAWAGRQV